MRKIRGAKQINSPIKFGTDGWRAIIAEDFTFDNVRVCAQAVANQLKQAGLASRGVVVGYDTRFASEDFAQAAAEVVAANNIKVYLCHRATPTPVVSYGVLAKKAGGAIVITASHIPPQWNGFKFKSEHGSSAPVETITQLEKNIVRIINTGKISRLPLAKALKQGLVEHIDLTPVYLEQIGRLIDLDALRRARLKLVIDSMYGTGAGFFKTLLNDVGIELTEINSEPNPAFPGMRQPEPIAINLSKLTARVKKEKASIGIATDGDADRLGIIDEKGNFLTQLQVFALLSLYLLEIRRQRGAIVKTITTTSMVYRLGELFNVPVYETAVGFKHVAPIMMKENALIGGEESGGYGFRGHIPERDAIPAGLYFLDLMVKMSKTPSELLEYLYSKVGPHHYHRMDITFPRSERETLTNRLREAEPASIDGVRVAKKDTFDGFRFTLTDNTWLLVRFSWTEPLLRIYAESDSQARVERLLEIGKEIVGI